MADDFPRIKANVQKMIGLQAPEADIDGYLSQEGWSPEQFKAAALQSPDMQAVTSAVTAPATIQGIANNLQAPMQAQPTLGDEAKRQLALTGRYLLQGAAAAPSLVGDAANSVINLGSAVANKVTGSQIPAIPSMSKSVDTLLNAAGVPEPQTKIEKIVAEPSKFLASIPSFGIPAAASKIEELAPLAEKYLSQAVGAGAGGTAYGVAKELAPNNPKAQMAALLVGTLAGGKGGAMMDTAEAATKAATPTNEVLHDTAQQYYKAAEESGVQLKPEAMQRLATNVSVAANKFGYDPDLQPGVSVLLKRLGDLSETGATAQQIMNLRKIAGQVIEASGTNNSQRSLAGVLDRSISEFFPTLKPEEVTAGDAPKAVADLQAADKLWSRYAKSSDLDERQYAARIQAGATNSGGNVDNQMRQRVAAILKDPNQRNGYTPDEVAQMEKIAVGTKGQNALRIIGKASPQGNGLMGVMTGAALVSNPAMTLPFLAGAIAKPIANHMTAANVRDLSELIRSGGEKALVKELASTTSAAPAASALTASQRSLLQALIAPYRGNNGLQPSFALPASPTGTSGRNTQGQRQ